MAYDHKTPHSRFTSKFFPENLGDSIQQRGRLHQDNKTMETG